MRKASELFGAAAAGGGTQRRLSDLHEPILKAEVRRLGPRPGEVAGRTVIAGRSYDHVRTRDPSRHELHPSNLIGSLGEIVKHGTVYKAYRKGSKEAVVAPDRHKAARAIVTGSADGGGAMGNEGGISSEEAAYG